MEQKYFEDLNIGDKFYGATKTINDAHFSLFSGLTGDNHPIHYDDEYVKGTRFEKRVTHGLLLMSMTALGASNLSFMLINSMEAFLEQSCRFLKPVLIGDTIKPELEVIEKQRKKKGRGLVVFKVTIKNQNNGLVLEGEHRYLIRCREDR